MQSPSTPDRLETRHEHTSQHSPQCGSRLSSSDPNTTAQQHIPPPSRDTTPVAISKPCTPPSASQSEPPTSTPESAARSTSSVASSVSISSVLSPTAPQFKARLIDSPIDLHGISLSSSDSSVSSARDLAESPMDAVLDISKGVTSLQDGLTPTQESFTLRQTPTLPASASPLGTSASLCSESTSTKTSSTDPDFRTPNVYINGLPPNFPEDQLLAMTREFGEVLSVRTFTRHVSDKPSGYGFVLFGSIEAAGKCIDTLRKYRNLHPSFSKQIHKIPGTVYATAGASPQPNDPPDSFKARMERLKDIASTNLYMEGLPLSIDEASLAALVQPYRIMSSRFFQTRLSNPPRIIAFVRLESRTAAEEVIERLHGRMVRGWNDTGCRISVRFADTSEQRELRRVERVTREGGDSPARLTMAQAALLNLKGTQLHPGAQTPRIPSPHFGLSPTMRPNRAFSPEFVGKPLPPPIGLHHQARDESIDIQDLSSALTNVHMHQPYDGLNAQAADFAGPRLRMPPHMLATDPAISHDMLQLAMGVSSGATSTRAASGYTPMEQLLLQVHARRHQEIQAQAINAVRPDLGHRLGRTSEFNISAPEFNPSATTLSQLQNISNIGVRQGGARLMDYVPSMSEEDFHAAARGNQRALPGEPTMSPVALSPQSERTASRLTLDEASRASFTRQRNQTHAEARAQAQAEQVQALHTRSTTFPSHYLSTDRSNTQSLLNARTNAVNANQSNLNNAANTLNGLNSISKNISYNTSTTVNTNTNTSNSTLIRPGTGKNMNMNSSSSNQHNHDASRPNNTPRPVGTKIAHTTANVHLPVVDVRNNRVGRADAHQHTRVNTTLTGRQVPLVRNALSHDADDEDEGSGLDSPALSYSVRTPASLSPATPFSAFGETFDGPPMSSVNVAAPGNDVGLGVAVGLPGMQQKTQQQTTHASN